MTAVSVRVPAGRRFFCSWSGGKDSYLALQRAVAAGGRPVALLCMMHEEGAVSRGHGLPVALLEAQAASLGIPLVTSATTWDEYEATFVAALHQLRGRGVEAGVFGDIDSEGHRAWVESVCEIANMTCHLPLWQEPHRGLVDELLVAGVAATVVAVDPSRLSVDVLGRDLDGELIDRFAAAGVDVCGEAGEFHTVVTAAPLFAEAVPLRWDGREERDGHWVLRFHADQSESIHERGT